MVVSHNFCYHYLSLQEETSILRLCWLKFMCVFRIAWERGNEPVGYAGAISNFGWKFWLNLSYSFLLKTLPSFWHSFLGQHATPLWSAWPHGISVVSSLLPHLFFGYTKFSSLATKSITQLFVWLFLCFFLSPPQKWEPEVCYFMLISEKSGTDKLMITMVWVVPPSAVSYWVLCAL